MNAGTYIRPVGFLLLAVFQVIVLFQGVHWVGKVWAPVLVAIVSLAIPALYLVHLLWMGKRSVSAATARSPQWHRLLFALAVIAVMLLTYEELRKLMVATGNPARWSDVIPQIETLYYRWRDGIFPYAPVPLEGYSPYPVYMPLHWLPVGLADLLRIDSRWIGYGLLVLATGLAAWALAARKTSLPLYLLMALVPPLALWGFILWGGIDIPVSYELLIAAYYLVVAAGLLARSWTLIAIGIVLCALSRYTLVFWLPLLAVVIWVQWPKRYSFGMWGLLAVAVVGIYIVPFLLHDPTILGKGLHYHNGAALGEWIGLGNPPIAYTFERGIYFGLHFRDYLPGTLEHRLLLARVVQAGVMLLLLGLGLWGFFRWRHRMDVFRYALAMLYTTLVCFYLFGPLTYSYYWIVPLAISAVMVMDIIRDQGQAAA